MAVPRSVLPFREFVLKVHSRCDLACDHCYVYEHADQSWRARPRTIASETVAKAGERIAEHARQHRLPWVRIVIHGGEPLLVGPQRLARIASALRAAIEPVCALDLRIHTNGVRLDMEFCEVFLAWRIKVGISLDGDRAANDLHRRFTDGRSSHAEVVRAINLLRQPRYRDCYAGLLCTIDVRSDPVAVYQALADLDPPAVDFLLPHATWDTPPPGADIGRTPYADWLAAIFDAWIADGRRIRVRTFESIIATTLGRASRSEALGLEASDLLVIEADGSLEQADSMKVAFDGAPATGLDLFAYQLDEAAAHPGIRARQRGLEGVSPACRRCPVVASCGGGLYAHRYRSGGGFDNPSVYCADLETIITHVRAGLPRAPAPSAQPRSTHKLGRDQFDAIAGGLGDAAAVNELAGAQRSRQRALLQGLRERASRQADGMFLAGWDLFAQVEREHTEEFGRVSAHPYVRSWAVRCLRAGTGRDGSALDSGRLPQDAAHLAAIAAAAAIRAGMAAEIDIPVTDGYACLPTLGRLKVGAGAAAAVTVCDGGFSALTRAGRWRVRLAEAESEPRWQPVRQVRSGQFTVQLEDTDPYRDCHEWPVAGRLSPDEADRWQQQFAEAWPLLEHAFPNYLPGLASGLSTILPLANAEQGREISAASRQSFGAVAMALPVEADVLALLILHEFQHVKLGGLLDMFKLCDADERLFYAPWRDDPRPIEQLLQGAYAHLAVTDYWRVRRNELPGAQALAAAERFARWRMLTAEAIETTAASGALTPLGVRFVAGMSAAIEPWLDEHVPRTALASAREWAAERRAAWRQREKRGKDRGQGD